MRPLRRHALVGAIGLSLALAGDAPAAPEPEDDGGSADVYVRRRMDIRGTVSWVAEEARRLGAGQVIFVLDAVTFAPPPGLTEFTSEYGFFRDLGVWVSALAEWPATSGAELRATSSLAPWTVPQASPGFAEALTELVQRRWYLNWRHYQGRLVSRAACQQTRQQQQRWLVYERGNHLRLSYLRH